jgi:hypothetical protein
MVLSRDWNAEDDDSNWSRNITVMTIYGDQHGNVVQDRSF